MNLNQLKTGALFCFADDPQREWEYRGNGWYAHPAGYDGGPWVRTDNPIVHPTGFELVNDPPARKSARFDNQERTLQRKLIDGLDCLPGQQDLF